MRTFRPSFRPDGATMEFVQSRNAVNFNSVSIRKGSDRENSARRRAASDLAPIDFLQACHVGYRLKVDIHPHNIVEIHPRAVQDCPQIMQGLIHLRREFRRTASILLATSLTRYIESSVHENAGPP